MSNVGADAALRKLAAIYANGIRDGEAFDDMLRLRTKLIPYDGDDSWVEPTLRDVADCLASEHAPEPASSCAFCDYVAKVSAAGRWRMRLKRLSAAAQRPEGRSR